MKTRTFLIILLLAFVVILSLTIGLANSLEKAGQGDEIQRATFEVLLQLLVVVIIGGVIALLFEMVKQSRSEAFERENQAQNRSRIRAELRANYLVRLGRVYREVKAARRTLRAGGFTDKYGPTPAAVTRDQIRLYMEQMNRVNDAQLEIEGLKIEAESLPDFVELQNIPCKLYQMEQYLAGILGDYERMTPNLLAHNTDEQPVAFVLPEPLKEFTSKAKKDSQCACDEDQPGCHFKSQFSKPYESMVTEISQSLVESSGGR